MNINVNSLLTMPAPKDPRRIAIWKHNLSIAHKGCLPWNKGIRMSENFRLKMRKISLEFWSNPKNAEKIKMRNIKVGRSKIGDRNPMKRLEIRMKHSEKMMGKLVGDKNPSKKPEVRRKISEALKGHAVLPEIRKKLSTSLMGKLVGELNPFYGKHHSKEVREKSRIRAINQIASGQLRNKRTSIESKILEELKNHGMNFLEQCPLENMTVADFYLPQHRIVIYCDGNFWHRGKWAYENGVVEKDQKQKITLENLGYKVFRFNEEKINESPTGCLNEIENYILTNNL